MRSKKIEEMKALTAEALRKQGLSIENGTIRSAGISDINGLAVVTAKYKETAKELGIMRKPSWDYE